MPGGNLGDGIVVEIGPAFGNLEFADGAAERVRAGSGVVARDLDELCRSRDGFLPFLPSSAPWCLVGGMVANNAAGARSFRWGSAAPWVETVEGLYAWGEPFRVGRQDPVPSLFAELRSSLLRELTVEESGVPAGWPKVRKNSSGYALDRFLAEADPAQLLVGSEGTLALITSVELGYPRLPEERAVVVLRADSSADLAALAVEAHALGAAACEFLGRRFIDLVGDGLKGEVSDLSKDAYALVLVELSGTRDGVRDGTRALQSLCAATAHPAVTAESAEAIEQLWRLRHGASPSIAREAGKGRISTQFIEDSVVPPARLGEYLDGLDEILADLAFDAIIFGHAGDANVHVNPLVDISEPDWKPRVRQALEEVAGLVGGLGGTLSGEHGDGRLRTPLLSQVWPEQLIRAFQHVKEALDPKGILNPGVIVPFPDQDPLEGFVPRARSYPA